MRLAEAVVRAHEQRVEPERLAELLLGHGPVLVRQGLLAGAVVLDRLLVVAVRDRGGRGPRHASETGASRRRERGERVARGMAWSSWDQRRPRNSRTRGWAGSSSSERVRLRRAAAWSPRQRYARPIEAWAAALAGASAVARRKSSSGAAAVARFDPVAAAEQPRLGLVVPRRERRVEQPQAAGGVATLLVLHRTLDEEAAGLGDAAREGPHQERVRAVRVLLLLREDVAQVPQRGAEVRVHLERLLEGGLGGRRTCPPARSTRPSLLYEPAVRVPLAPAGALVASPAPM